MKALAITERTLGREHNEGNNLQTINFFLFVFLIILKKYINNNNVRELVMLVIATIINLAYF